MTSEWDQEYPKDNRYRDWPLSEKVTISPELQRQLNGYCCLGISSEHDPDCECEHQHPRYACVVCNENSPRPNPSQDQHS